MKQVKIHRIGKSMVGPDVAFTGWTAAGSPSWRKQSAEVLALEESFYCAHNAAQGARPEQETAPANFHPILSDGVIYERRHDLGMLTTGRLGRDEPEQVLAT
ncbi:hypothetical protein ACFOPQ_06070 [Deinococcus antarcticus]|uniref:Uncharacterized protein n=1 Tax=Deinococcus antarcticus TaxID=1298767 RepID=A0ABV8A508_9DEIO